MLNTSDHVLYWFTRDLRIQDNDILDLAKQASSLTCVYVVDPSWFKHAMWQRPSLSAARWQFTMESIESLKQGLSTYGHRLLVLYGSSLDMLNSLLETHAYDHLMVAKHSGSYEKRVLKELARKAPGLKISEVEHYTLFSQEQLPFELECFPASFSKFRKLIEAQQVDPPKPAPAFLPPMKQISLLAEEQLPAWLPSFVPKSLPFVGGEVEAHRHLNEYFSSEFPSHYKSLRNELAGRGNSSKLSAWLNQGCLSARQVKQAVRNYELENGENASTQWLYVELLWREFFQWLHCKIGDQLFHFKGSKSQAPLTTFYPERFRKWCEGETPFSLVNACMKELKETGYLSNRGRQIVASCLVNELEVDWRYGAAWFEHCLIDYDVAVNWGNWQYIAGVGVDPRGGRHFNLEKQTQLYDPDALYRKRWGALSNASLDSRDAADWPIAPEGTPEN